MGDISRNTFDRKKHYTSVRMQQGRLQLDSDWNEQADIQRYLEQIQIRDCIGLSGAPQADDHHFQLTVANGGSDLTIAPGRIYVDGILCELDQAASYLKQPYFPLAALPTSKGTYIAYLDVWQRHISAIEDPGLREIALSHIPDTTTRTQTVWQLKLTSSQDWSTLQTPRQPTIVARIEAASGNSQARVGDQGLGNQLYRVEIHKIEQKDKLNVYFKWSRDNASIARSIQSFKEKDNILVISTFGQDESEFFQPGQWIEITDDARELHNLPGTLVRLTGGTAGNLLAFDPNTIDGDPITAANFPLQYHPKVRRWETNAQSNQAIGLIDEGKQAWQALELGLSVQFTSPLPSSVQAQSPYQPGDYWLLPVRANQTIETTPWHNRPLLADGIEHHYCALAEVPFTGDSFQQEGITDKRNLFLPLTALPKPIDPTGGTAINGPLQIGVTDTTNPASASLQVQAEALKLLGAPVQIPDNRTDTTSSIVLENVTLGKDVQVGDRLVLSATTSSDTLETSIASIDPISGSLTLSTPIPATFPASFTVATQRSIARFSDDQQIPHLIISAQGNVGIGLTNPTAPFQVNGLARVSDIQIDNTFSARIFSGEQLTLSGSAQIAGPLTLTTDAGIQTPSLNVTGNATTHILSIDQLTVTNTAQLNGSLTVAQNITANGNVDIGNSSTPNARVTIHGDLVADRIHANSSFQIATGPIVHLIASTIDATLSRGDAIPTEQAIKTYVEGNLSLKADRTYVDQELAQKADRTYVDQGLAQKAERTYVDQELAKKVDQTALTEQIAPKADLTYVDQGLAKKADTTYVNTELGKKADLDFVTGSLTQKADLHGASQVAFNASQLFIGSDPTPLNDPTTSLFVRSPGAIDTSNTLSGSANQTTLTLNSSADQPTPHVGDWITVNGETRLISQIDLPSLQIRSPFQTALDQAPFSYQPPTVRVTALDGTTQLVLHAENSNPDKPGNVILGITHPNAKLQVESDIAIAGTITALNIATNSSQALKENVVDLSTQEVASLLSGLNPVKFSYKLDPSHRDHFGFIAESVPDIVASPDKTAIHSIEIIAVLTKVIKDQQNTITNLATVVNQHQQQIELLTKAISILQQIKTPTTPPATPTSPTPAATPTPAASETSPTPSSAATPIASVDPSPTTPSNPNSSTSAPTPTPPPQ